MEAQPSTCRRVSRATVLYPEPSCVGVLACLLATRCVPESGLVLPTAVISATVGCLGDTKATSPACAMSFKHFVTSELTLDASMRKVLDSVQKGQHSTVDAKRLP